MTFENGGSLRSSPSTSRRTPNKINKRSKLTNSFLARASEDKSDSLLSQTPRSAGYHKQVEAKRFSSAKAKRWISPVYRERASSRPKTSYKDISSAYPTPELNYDFSLYDSLDGGPQNTEESNSGFDEQNTVVQNGASTSHSNGEQSHQNNGNASSQPHWRSALLSLRNNRRMSLPVTSLEKQLENALTLVKEIPKEKNEAEIIDGPRRGSLEDSAGLSVPGMAVLKLQSRNSGVTRSASLKVGRGESLNRELRSHYMNGMQERKLRNACQELDRQSYVGMLEHKNRKQQLSQQHAELLKRSPSTDDWMSHRKCRTVSLQERERENIDRRFSRRVRHFRAPKPLQDEVSAIRSVAMFHAGLYNVSRPPPSSPVESKMLLKRIATIAGGGGGSSLAQTQAWHPLTSDKSRRNSRDEEDDSIIDLVSDENYDFQHSYAAANRQSVSGGETRGALRQLHRTSIPPRVAESGLAGLLNHSRRMSLVGVPTAEDMLQGLPEYLTGNEDTSTVDTARSRRTSTYRGLSRLAGELNPQEQEAATKDDDVFENGDDDDAKEANHLSESDSNDDPFSDLDQMSSDSEEEGQEGEEREEDGNSFGEDRRNI